MKTPIKNHSGPDDGPEEGEIVSDDLEDISDDSMSCTPSIGKSLCNNEPIRALSLSSVTDFDEMPAEKRRKRRKSYSQRRGKRRRKSRRKILDSDSSDNNTMVDGRLKFQLKAAVHVGSEEDHKNRSLRTRLRGMVKSSSGPESETVHIGEQKSKQDVPAKIVANSENKTNSSVAIIDLVDQDTSSVEILVSGSNSAQENNDSATEQPKAEDIDSELIQLRIEALKTAINNKFANRRKRKIDGEGVTSSDDTNKENTSNNNSEENQGKKSPANENRQVGVPQGSPSINTDSDLPPSPEEDEDVLRAILLASISKKITKTDYESPELVVNQAHTKMTVINHIHKMKTNNFKLNNNVKRVLNKGIVNKVSGATNIIRMPQVKPLIINLNSDSDSDLEFNSSPEKSPKKRNNIGDAIENTVEKFLKEQRAKVESAVPANVISSTRSDPMMSPKLSNNLPISKTVNKPQLSVKSVSKDKSKPQKRPEGEKSALKFLPESKREEYRNLQNLLRLKKAQMKKPKVRRISLKTNELSGKNPNKEENEFVPQALPVKSDIINKIKTTTQNPIVNKKMHQIKPNGPYKKTGSVNLKNTPPLAARTKQASSNVLPRKITNNKSSQTTELVHIRLSSAIEARIQDFRQQELMAAKREQERKEESLVLRAILKQLQTVKDGRLQIHDKYKSLRPLVKKLNEASKEQKQCEQEIERLMRQLADSRLKQEILHKNMLKSVKELAVEKKKIDISSKTVATPKTNALIITSTPIKPGGIAVPLTPSSSFATSISDQSADQTLEENNKVEPDGMLNTWEQSTICNNPLSETQVNDIIDSVIVTKEQVAEMVNERSQDKKPEKVRYISPLDVAQRPGTIDPFGIMCPFEVNGMCKDPECSFNHLPK